MSEIKNISRRDFLKVSTLGGTGLALGLFLPACSDTTFATLMSDGAGAIAEANNLALAAGSLMPNVWLQIATDDTVTIWVHRSEMGQGVRTSLPMIVADELDADWSRVRIVQADAHPSNYGWQMTVGSTSVRGGAWLPLRRAGAAAREMLIATAAAQWGVNAVTCRTENGQVLHDTSDRALSYGELAEAAATQPVPEEPRLKEPSEFRLIGQRLPLLDTPNMVTGKAVFGIDVRVSNLRFATVVHPPIFGGSVQSLDASQALEIEGVQDVVEISRGVAVVADSTWAAFKGAKALDITWDPGDFAMSSADIAESFVRLSEQDGAVARNDGNAETALQQAAQYLEATYEVPYLAHGTMEPMNCTADVRSDRCEIWAPTQGPQRAQSTAAQITGLPIEAVTVHVTLVGCGLGRRSRDDFVRDAVETSMRVGAPVQVVWTREEDIQHDFYRPALYSRLEAGLNATGQLTAWKNRVVAPPIRGGRGGGSVDYNGVDGAANLLYNIPNFFVDNCQSDVPVPTGHWRSVGVSQNTFITESFIDELAHAAGRDPFEFRYELLSEHPRMQRVLELAAEKAGWETPLPEERARGMALVENKGSLVAEVAEVLLRGGRVHVHRVTCAVDCGQVIHPGIVEAQMAGSIVNGLTATLYGEITLEAGRVTQSNFHDYQMLRMDEMPDVEVHIVESAGEPGAVGEPGLPPIAPAVTNALFALTGTRIRRLPIQSATFQAGVMRR